MYKHQFTYTFIIPHHNSPKLLNRCLDSIPQREDIQIIVVDDNSDEDKRPTIRRGDVELVYIDAEQTKGAGRARNFGLKKARGKWLLFADCDDYYNKGFIYVLDKYINSNIDAVYFNYDFKDGSTGLNKSKTIIQNALDTYSGTEEELLFVKFRSKAPWNKMINSELVHRYDMFFEEVPNGNDILFSMFTACFAQKVIITNEVLYTYLSNGGSILTQSPTISASLCRITHDIKMVQIYKYYCPKLVHSVFANILRKIKSIQGFRKVGLVISLIYNSLTLYRCRNEWVELIKSKNAN